MGILVTVEVGWHDAGDTHYSVFHSCSASDVIRGTHRYIKYGLGLDAFMVKNTTM